MPKRSLDTTTSAMPATERAPPVKAQKTERSHEENQERAYIAASRRADRSLEARVQSARMASEIHRKRTGRGLKVSEEIVMKEEMYEEEEDDLPRHYKYLTAHLQTNSPELNHRVNAFVTTQAAMATMARYNEVNRLFSESFPSAASFQQQFNGSMYMTPLMSPGAFSPRGSISGSTQSSPTTAHGQPQFASLDRRVSEASVQSPPSQNGAASSPPALSPCTTTTDSESRHTPFHTPASAFPHLQLDPQLARQSTQSSFTPQLPKAVQTLAQIDMNDEMASHFLGEDSSAFTFDSTQPGPGQGLATDGHSPYTGNDYLSDGGDYTDEAFFSPVEGSMDFFDGMTTADYSRLGTPTGGIDGNAWESFVDFEASGQSGQ
ncbi:hypothetical protein F4780DRAFT_535824 [Xylariomycetidae sp. FL0641]|nr:hypothetical protein F4780DRAFT_535824 [Xylariomycetidae sp. FL0641]